MITVRWAEGVWGCGGSFSAFSLTGLVSALAETQKKGPDNCVLREVKITLPAY